MNKGPDPTSNRISNLRSAGEGLMELAAEFFKRAEHYSLPNPAHGVKVKVEVMQRVEGSCGHFTDDEKMAKIGAREVPASVAAAIRIGRRHVFGVAGVLDCHRSATCQQLPIARVPRRQHTIEEVDPSGHTFHQ